MFDFHQEANMEELGFTLMAENDANIAKAEACAKELEHVSYSEFTWFVLKKSCRVSQCNVMIEK